MKDSTLVVNSQHRHYIHLLTLDLRGLLGAGFAALSDAAQENPTIMSIQQDTQGNTGYVPWASKDDWINLSAYLVPVI